MLTQLGRPVAPGKAKGNAFVYIDILQRDAELKEICTRDIPFEQARIDRALMDVRQSLETDAKDMDGQLGGESAGIFLAQAAILSDASLLRDLKTTLETDLIDAEQVVRIVFRKLARRFRDLPQEVFQDRGDDIDDLSRRLLLSLGNIHAHGLETLPPNTVLVARRLLPSDTVYLSRSSTVAVLAEFAGPAAHAALLAREMGIPCVGGIPNLLDLVQTGDLILVDGTEGTAVIRPEPAAIEQFDWCAQRIRQSGGALARELPAGPAVMQDGTAVSVMANVRSREDVKLCMKLGADGIGLFRTEPFFLSTKHLPSAREFAEFLEHCLEPAQGKEISVRLLDIGADKNPIYLHLPYEADPFLGRRGLRVLRKYPALLNAQLHAMLQVSQQIPIGVLIPMVTLERDVVEIVEQLHRLAREIGIGEIPRIGAMIETPAAALAIPTLKPHLDFFSIGSNDLTQYTMAAGRENPLVADYFVDDHESVLRLIELVVREAGSVPVSLCGELAGRTEVIPKLLKIGLRSLSVSASSVPVVKQAICEASW